MGIETKDDFFVRPLSDEMAIEKVFLQYPFIN